MGEIWFKLTGGTGGEEPLFDTHLLLTSISVSPDGRFLMYISIDPTTNADLWVLPLSEGAGRGTPFVFVKTPFREAYGSFSPDGRWVAYHSNESGRSEVYVRPFVPPGGAGTAAPAAAGQVPVSTAGGIHSVWRVDGQELEQLAPGVDEHRPGASDEQCQQQRDERLCETSAWRLLF